MATFTTENIYLWHCIIVRKEKKCVTCGKMYYCESVIARCTRHTLQLISVVEVFFVLIAGYIFH